MVASFIFDSSIREMFLPLVSGTCLCISEGMLKTYETGEKEREKFALIAETEDLEMSSWRTRNSSRQLDSWRPVSLSAIAPYLWDNTESQCFFVLQVPQSPGGAVTDLHSRFLLPCAHVLNHVFWHQLVSACYFCSLLLIGCSVLGLAPL